MTYIIEEQDFRGVHVKVELVKPKYKNRRFQKFDLQDEITFRVEFTKLENISGPEINWWKEREIYEKFLDNDPGQIHPTKDVINKEFVRIEKTIKNFPNEGKIKYKIASKTKPSIKAFSDPNSIDLLTIEIVDKSTRNRRILIVSIISAVAYLILEKFFDLLF